MEMFGNFSVVITVAVLISYLNHRFVKMPTTIAIMVGAIGLSLVLIFLDHYFIGIEEHVRSQLEALDFHDLLMFVMLPFLLFAGALTVDLPALAHRRKEIAVLAMLGTLLSTFIVGIGSYYLLILLGNPIPFIYCLLFGALISPTDPIAVIAMLKSLGASKELDALVGGESLFNDGVAIVIFLTIYHIAFSSGATPTVSDVTFLFARQAIGGIAYGLVLGLVAYWLMSKVDDPHIEILLTLAVVTGGYYVAEHLEISGPLSMVVAGIFIGNYGRKYNMSAHTREHLDSFWELVDELLNAALFFLVGLEILLLFPIPGNAILIGLLAIPLVLLSRLTVVAGPFMIFKRRDEYPAYIISILTWGGLRGGLALAMALALPKDEYRPIVLVMTYACVVFSVVVQGMTVKPLVERSINEEKKRAPRSEMRPQLPQSVNAQDASE